MMSRIEKYIFISICVLALVVRFWQLGHVPIGITNDEGGSLYSSLSIAQTGKSLDGMRLPLSFNLDNSYGPVAIYLDVPFVKFMGVSAYALRFPFALLSFVSVILMYAVTRELIGNRRVALASAFGLAISPWHIHMNHGAYDGPITFLFLVSVYLLLLGRQRISLLWSLPSIIFSYYAYHATKIFWLCFLPMYGGLYAKEFWQKKRKESFIFAVSIIISFGLFLVVLRSQGVTRQQVLLLPDSVSLSQSVNRQREYSVGPEFMKKVFVNKVTVYARSILERYVQAFSPNYLFLYGEGGIYGTYKNGVLYLIDVFLLLFGISYLIRRGSVRQNIFVYMGIALSPIPSAITTDVSFALRGIFMLPFLMIIWGCGMYSVMLWIARQRSVVARVSMYTFVGVGYIASFLSFFHIYFHEYSVYGSEYWFASSRDVAELAGSLRQTYKNVIIGKAGKMFLFQYALYNQTPLSDVANAWNTKNPPYRVARVSILEDCLPSASTIFDPEKDLPPSSVYITRSSCHPGATPSATIRDRGESLRAIWDIFAREAKGETP